MEIKSQHELTTAGSRQSDVLIEALKKAFNAMVEERKEKLLEDDVELWRTLYEIEVVNDRTI